MERYVLASGSPRRKELLSKLNIRFKIIPSKYEENLETKEFSYKIIENLAYNKALFVTKELSDNAIVIGADTVVVFQNNILTKPLNRQDAFNTLKLLSNNEHTVVTAIAVINMYNNTKSIKSVTTKVAFNKLSDDIINNYIDNFKPFDKAGSYGIQELPEGFVNYIDGSRENVIGLCTETLEKMLF